MAKRTGHKRASAAGHTKPVRSQRPFRSDPVRRGKFLAWLAESCSVVEACQRSGVPRQTAYDLRREDQAFAAAWDDGLRLGVEALHDEAVRRAKKGVRRPVYQGKELVGYVSEYSDRLLMFLLKAHDPEKYADRHQTTATIKSEVKLDGKLAHEYGAEVTAALQRDLIAAGLCDLAIEAGDCDVPRDGTAQSVDSVDASS